MQTGFSLGIGKIVDHVGFSTVCLAMAALPMVGVAILRSPPEQPRDKQAVSGAIEIRWATREDLPAIARIQAGSLKAPAWNPSSYLDYDCRVAV